MAETGGAADELLVLKDLLVQAHRSKSLAQPSTSSAGQAEGAESEVRVKLEYMGEKRSILVRRPLRLAALSAKVEEMFGRPLSIYYTASSSEIIVPMRTQEDLERALQLLASSSHVRSLRLLLSQHSSPAQPSVEAPVSFSVGGEAGDSLSPSGPLSPASAGRSDSLDEGRFSPPPGTKLPPARRKSSKTFSRTSSRRSEGEFIPEGLSMQEIPYRSSASSRASSRVSADGCGHCSVGSFRSGLGGAGSSGGFGGRVRGSWSRRGLGEGSRASSSSSSGLVPDMAVSSRGGGGQDSPWSPQAPTNWRQGRCLGSGAYGSVYLCYDADTSRELAVKRVLLSPAEHNRKNLRKEVAALENEVRLLRNLEHERVVKYLGFSRDDESLSIFMEYMGGGSVKDEVRTYGPLQESVVRKYTRQILEGLTYLHHYEIVHRDIKCANILRDGAGNVKIGDFGSGKRLATICTQSGAVTFIGTPYYMAPEVVSGRRYGRKADLWSLGCSLVEMLSGQPPWRDLEPMAALFRIALDEPDLPALLPSPVSDDLRRLLALLFQREPSQRPPASDLLQLPALQ